MKAKLSSRPVSHMKQIKIIKQCQQVFSSLQFEAFPSEIILQVFSYLKNVDLLKCGQVSKRFRAISKGAFNNYVDQF